MSVKLMGGLSITLALVFFAGMQLGAALSMHILKRVGTEGVGKFTWLSIDMPAGWLWWAAFVIIGTCWVVKP